MKPRHAATLALVGWYLIAPVRDEHGKAEITLPISEWLQVDAFDSANECRKAGFERQRSIETHDPSPSARTLAGVWQCIASDDPRLKEK